MPTPRPRAAPAGQRAWDLDPENSIYTTGPNTPQALQESVDIAINVALQIKAMNLQSTNIIKVSGSRPDAQLVENRAALRDQLDILETDPRGEGTVEAVLACAARAIQTKVGNCQEQASVAFALLVRHATSAVPVQLISIDSGAVNHVFAVLGTWPRGGVACDPWADVYCRSEAYESNLIRNMSEWATKKRKIAVAGEGLMSPPAFAIRLSQGMPSVLAAHISQ